MISFREYLIEIANTILKSEDLIDVYYPSDDNMNKTSIFFKHKDLIYGVGLQQLDISSTPMGSRLYKKLNRLSILGVEFGTVEKPGAELNTKQLKVGHSSAVKVLSIISNLVQNYCEQNNIDIVIFSSKNDDGMFSRRGALYSSLAGVFSKRYGYSYKSYSRNEGIDFIIFRNNVSLSSIEEVQLKKLMELTPTFVEKLILKFIK